MNLETGGVAADPFALSRSSGLLPTRPKGKEALRGARAKGSARRGKVGRGRTSLQSRTRGGLQFPTRRRKDAKGRRPSRLSGTASPAEGAGVADPQKSQG